MLPGLVRDEGGGEREPVRGFLLIWYNLRGKSLYDLKVLATRDVISSSCVGDSMMGTPLRSLSRKSLSSVSDEANCRNLRT